MVIARTGRRRFAVVALAAVLGLASACTGGSSAPGGHGGSSKGGPSVTIASPKSDATGVPASAEIRFQAQGATSAAVELADAGGQSVEGVMRPEGANWMPRRQLEYGTKYTATVTVTDAAGRTAKTTSSFTTMAKPADLERVSSIVGDDNVVGIGMPMIVQFGRDVPQDLRATVQRRMFMQTSPHQVGAWSWYNAREVHYRPKEFWQPGTKLNMTVLAGGLPLGGDWYGRADLTVSAEVGSALTMTVDNATKQMTVTEDGKVIRTIPVSLGRPGMPSSSGTMLVMERLRKTIFDTTNAPNPANRYKIPIEYAQRLTWGGEFIHAAPWSVADQGRRNVSHGCINMSTADAQWLFSKTRLGDPVTVKGTERQLEYGNGWTDWSIDWSQYLKGSALPPPAGGVLGSDSSG